MPDSASITATDRQVLITRIFEAPREQSSRPGPVPTGRGVVRPRALRHAARARCTSSPRVSGRWELTMVERGSGGELPVRYEIVELVDGADHPGSRRCRSWGCLRRP